LSDVLHQLAFLTLFFGLSICAQAFALLALGARWHCCNAAARMPALTWPRGVPRFCCFRFGNVRGCGAKVRLDHIGQGERLRYRMCRFSEWLMCPACYSMLPNLCEHDEDWRHEVHKDDGDTAGSSIGSTVLRASSKVKQVMKKPASK